MALLASCWGAARAADIRPSPEAAEGLKLLHQGRFREATGVFDLISKSRPEDPEGPMLEGLTTWWKLLDNPKDKALLETLLGQLEEATRRGEAMVGGEDRERGRILAGTAQMLMAQTKASLKDYFAAGTAARRGHKHLEEVIDEDPRAVDAGFALGAYKYFAARLSWIVRLLRFVIFLPGGSEEEGVALLQRSADGGLYFATESNLLLAYINSTDEEDDFRKGLGYLRASRGSAPDSPLLDVVESRFLFALGELDQAEETARRSLALSKSLPGVADEIPALARLRLGLALYYEYRPEEAVEAIAPLLATPKPPLPEGTEDTLRSLAARLDVDRDRGEPDDPNDSTTPKGIKLVAAAPIPAGPDGSLAMKKLQDGDPRGAVETLLGILETRPNDTTSRYHLARAYMAAGEPEKSAAELSILLRPDTRIAKTLRGWALMRMGSAQQALGRSDGAKAFYKQAAELPGFIFRRAASDRLRNPSPRPPQG